MYDAGVGILNRVSRRALAAQARAQQLPTHVSADDLETMLADRQAYDVATARLVATMQRLGAKYVFDPVSDGIHNVTGQIIRAEKALLPPSNGLVEKIQQAAAEAHQNGTIRHAEEEPDHAAAS